MRAFVILSLIGLSTISCLPTTTNETTEEQVNKTKGLLIPIPPSISVGPPTVIPVINPTPTIELPPQIPLDLLVALHSLLSMQPGFQTYPTIETLPASVFSSIPMLPNFMDPFSRPLVSTASLPQPLKGTLIGYLKAQKPDALGAFARLLAKYRGGIDPYAPGVSQFKLPTASTPLLATDPIVLAALSAARGFQQPQPTFIF